MRQVNIHEAKTQLSRLIEAVEAGEEVIIARAGQPVARLTHIETRQTPRTPGALKGQIWIAPDFDELSEDLLDLFHDGPVEPETQQ